MSLPRFRLVLVGLGPALFFLALHARTLDYAFVWTDVPELLHGTILRPPAELLPAFGQPLHKAGVAAPGHTQPYYRPLQVVTASVLALAFDRSPRVFRAFNLFLGALTVALLSLWLARLFEHQLAGAAAGLLFAAHPVTLEIYVWASGLAGAWVGLWVVASAALFWHALTAATHRAGVLAAVGSLATLALGLLSKENAAVVPGLSLLLLVAYVSKHSVPQTRASWFAHGTPVFRKGLPIVFAQALMVALYLFAVRPAVLGTAFTGAAPIGGAGLTQVWTSLAHWPFDFAWLFFPLASTTSDAVRIMATPIDARVLAGLVCIAASIAALVVAWRRGAWTLVLGIAWVWIAFLPTSGVVPLLHARAERNLFLPWLGAVVVWVSLGRALALRGAPHAAGIAASLFLLGLLAGSTWARQPAWESNVALFEADVARDPRHREGRLNLIAHYAEAGRWSAAKRHVDILATQLSPTVWASYAIDGNLREAICLVNTAIGDDAQTARLATEVTGAAALAWGPSSGSACLAHALNRAGHAGAALPLYEQLHAATSDLSFALGVAHCHALLGDIDAAESWVMEITQLPRSTAQFEDLLAETDALIERIDDRYSRPPR